MEALLRVPVLIILGLASVSVVNASETSHCDISPRNALQCGLVRLQKNDHEMLQTLDDLFYTTRKLIAAKYPCDDYPLDPDIFRMHVKNIWKNNIDEAFDWTA